MKLLMTGATGMIGQHIQHLCRKRGIALNYLTRDQHNIKNDPQCRGFLWNPKSGTIDQNCLRGVDKIVHLAGASVAKRWTPSQKKAIIKSRLDSAQLLYDLLEQTDNGVTQFISASAIGIYPDSMSHLYTEESTEVAGDFLGKVVQKWEKAANRFMELGIEVTKIRIGLVLARESGFFPKIKAPIDNFMGTYLGSGNQWQSWIHIRDLARLFLFVAEEEQTGIFNGVAPHPVKQKNLIDCIAKHRYKSIKLPPLPRFALCLFFGQMAKMVLASQLVMSKRLESIGFKFKFHHLENAVIDLLEEEED